MSSLDDSFLRQNGLGLTTNPLPFRRSGPARAAQSGSEHGRVLLQRLADEQNEAVRSAVRNMGGGLAARPTQRRARPGGGLAGQRAGGVKGGLLGGRIGKRGPSNG